MMNNYSRILIVVFMFFTTTLYGQSMSSLAEMLEKSKTLYLKSVIKSYENESLKEVDTVWYAKQGDKIYYKTKEMEYLIDTDLLLINHPNQIVALKKLQDNSAMESIHPSIIDTTGQSEYVFDATCKCLKKEVVEENQTSSISIYFTDKMMLDKIIYDTQFKGIHYRNSITYEVFCTEINCWDSSFRMPKISDFLIQTNGKWKTKSTYSSYLLNIH